MKTAKEREDAFRADFAELLKKHDAEFQVTDDGKSWGLHSGIALVSMSSSWDETGEQVTEYTEFRL